jgi:phosphatidate cytidylyltransferase
MHLKRWLTALVFGPILLCIILSGRSLFFFIALAVVGLIGHQEYLYLAFPKNSDLSIKFFGGLLGAVIMIMPMIDATQYAWPVFAVLIVITFSFFLFKVPDMQEALEKSGKFLIGLFYIPLLLSFFVLVWSEKHAAQWIIFGLGVVFLGDTGAFYAGHVWGKHKLYPMVSPAKTLEGSVGGLALSLFFAMGYGTLLMPFVSIWVCLALATVLNILGQLGDLFESLLKRSTGVKDSGNCLPGHGGIMDRIDGVLFSAPALYVYVKYINPN